jgi:hypothetical protein
VYLARKWAAIHLQTKVALSSAKGMNFFVWQYTALFQRLFNPLKQW